jgi:hypothetical protein
MSASFFLNVAVGAGLGPTVVALLAASGFAAGGLGPALSAAMAGGYLLVALAALAAWRMGRGAERISM